MSTFERVEAQAVRAPRSGLTLLIAAPIVDDPSARWLDGFRWQPEVRAGSSAIGVACAGSNASRSPAGQPGVEQFDPFLVWAAEKCSTKERVRDFPARARRALESEQSYLVAAELWDGTIGHDDGNKSLTHQSADTITSGAVPASVALTYVDSALARRLRNRQGMVHARPEMVDVWEALQLLHRDAGAVLTPLGNVVVADAGYSGSGPRANAGADPVDADTESQWVYGTDVMSIRLGPVDVRGDDPSGVNRDTNDRTVWAQRLVGIQWDHHAHIAVEVEQGALV